MKRNRNKIILGVLAGAAVVSLASVGFAQWQIGVLKKEDNSNKFNFTVDTVVSETAVLDIKLSTDNSIKIGETTVVSGKDGVNTIDTLGGKLGVTVETFRIIIDDQHQLDNVTFSYTVGKTDPSMGRFQVTAGGGDDKFGRTESKTYNYLELANEAITSENLVKYFSSNTADIPGHTVYNLKKEAENNPYKTLGFKWGDFFNHEEPSTFYNNEIGKAEKTINEKIILSGTASKELETMRTKVANAADTTENVINMKVALTTKAK